MISVIFLQVISEEIGVFVFFIYALIPSILFSILYMLISWIRKKSITFRHFIALFSVFLIYLFYLSENDINPIFN